MSGTQLAFPRDYRARFSVSVYAGENALTSFNSRTGARIGKSDYYLDWGGTQVEERGEQVEATQVETLNLIDLTWEKFEQTALRAMNANNVSMVAERRMEMLRVVSTDKPKTEFLILRRPEVLDYAELENIVADAEARGIDDLRIGITAEVTPAAHMFVINRIDQLPRINLRDSASLDRSLSKGHNKIYVIDWSKPAQQTGGNLTEADWATISALVLEYGLKRERWAAEPSRIEKIADRPYDLIAWEVTNETWSPPTPRRVVFFWRRDVLSADEFFALIDEFEGGTRMSISPTGGVSSDIERRMDPMELMKYVGINFLRVLEASAEAGTEYYMDWDTPLAKLDPAAAGRQ